MLEKCKLAMRIVTDAYDGEIERLIVAACYDLGFADVDMALNSMYSSADPCIEQAVITYVRLNFGSPDDYDRLKRSYDEQKAQLQIHHLNDKGNNDCPCR